MSYLLYQSKFWDYVVNNSLEELEDKLLNVAIKEVNNALEDKIVDKTIKKFENLI